MAYRVLSPIRALSHDFGEALCILPSTVSGAWLAFDGSEYKQEKRRSLVRRRQSICSQLSIRFFDSSCRNGLKRARAVSDRSRGRLRNKRPSAGSSWLIYR